jgi:hypothetical protein
LPPEADPILNRLQRLLVQGLPITWDVFSHPFLEEISQLLLHAFKREVPESESDAIVRQAAERVAQHGLRALRAPDWPPEADPILFRLQNLLVQRSPITRDTFSHPFLETMETLDQITLFRQVDFRWFWCSRAHLYAADRHGQKACAMHQGAERQGRWRRGKAAQSKP